MGICRRVRIGNPVKMRGRKLWHLRRQQIGKICLASLQYVIRHRILDVNQLGRCCERGAVEELLQQIALESAICWNGTLKSFGFGVYEAL